MRQVLPLLLLASLAAAPATAQTAPTTDLPNGGTVTWLKGGDPKMAAAIAEARRGLPDFFRHLASPGPGESDFSLKFDIVPGSEAEYIWAGDLKRDAKGWTGVLYDDAVMIDGFKSGQRVAIPDEAIVDWGYWKNGVLQGNLTTRVVLESMDPAKAAAMRKDFGW